MHCTVEPKEIPEICTGNIVQQTSFWANVKHEQGLEPYAFGYHASGDLFSPEQSSSKIYHDDLLILVRNYNMSHIDDWYTLYRKTAKRNKRNYMASYAIQWEAIKTARNNGCNEYDMFGTAPNANQAHPMAGLYRFKSGFGGHLYHRMGCWDYPLNENLYNNFRASELNMQGYHM
ncbi:MAG: peptidoglycan bridge formation glycyltransferase FemA/FemB family protein [Bacteroidales bacterium]|nr:peptidoglycan bridge formation glycyltransferase FemA/FemB family protein [Bacteroidales bacterium]MDT8431503.1 peptidoglycan bridge formation glycyltransferase FemA/FemB family protein [Bacteroidales bacterium]